MGFTEILIVVIILLLVFGAGKLPAIGDALGRTVKSFRRAARTGDDDDDEAKKKRPALGHDNKREVRILDAKSTPNSADDPKS